MFTLSDYRQTAMPTLGTTETADGAHALAEALGIKEHACVLPVVGHTDGSGRFDRNADTALAAATYLGQLVLAAVR